MGRLIVFSGEVVYGCAMKLHAAERMRGAPTFLVDIIIAAAVLVVIVGELVRSSGLVSLAVTAGRRQLHRLTSGDYELGLTLGLLGFAALIAFSIVLFVALRRLRGHPGPGHQA